MAKLTKEEKKELKIKCARYSWKILEAKFCYYQGSKYKIKPILTDPKYDKLEKKYIRACKKLKIKPTASDLVGFPDKPKHGAKRMIAQHMIATLGKKSRVKEMKKEVSVCLKVLKKILGKELLEKKASLIYKKMKKEFDPMI